MGDFSMFATLKLIAKTEDCIHQDMQYTGFCETKNKQNKAQCAYEMSQQCSSSGQA